MFYVLGYRPIIIDKHYLKYIAPINSLQWTVSGCLQRRHNFSP